MLTQIINGRIFTPQGWLNEGSVLMRDGKILEVTNCDLALIGARLIDAKGMYIVPGFVCMHAHGGGGHDFTECTEEAFRSIINAHLGHGATSFYPTISSSPFEKLHQAAQVCEQLMAEPDSPVLGLHIEGPYLNKKMAGEQFADQVKEIDGQEYRELVESTRCIRRWDASPELPGALEFASYLREKGILAAVSHTEAEYDGIRAAYEAGFTHAAHFYNAMPGFHKRREYKYEGTVERRQGLRHFHPNRLPDRRHDHRTHCRRHPPAVHHPETGIQAERCRAHLPCNGRPLLRRHRRQGNQRPALHHRRRCVQACRPLLIGRQYRHHGRAGAYYGQGRYPVGRRPAHGFRNPGTHHGRVRPQRFPAKGQGRRHPHHGQGTEHTRRVAGRKAGAGKLPELQVTYKTGRFLFIKRKIL